MNAAAAASRQVGEPIAIRAASAATIAAAISHGARLRLNSPDAARSVLTSEPLSAWASIDPKANAARRGPASAGRRDEGGEPLVERGAGQLHRVACPGDHGALG